MNNLSDEVLAIARRYAAEQGRDGDQMYILDLMSFAGTLLSQNNGNAVVGGSLPLVSREELISLLEDKRICKMTDLPAHIYYLSRKETADYLMDNYVITKRQ